MRRKYIAGLGLLAGLVWPVMAAANDYPCLVEPHRVVELSTAVEGVLADVSVSKGDEVKAGDLVARLESDIESILVEEAKARATMRSGIQAREVSLKRERAKYQRALKLSSQKYVSSDELDELKSAVELARLELDAERENHMLAQIELKRAQARLAQRELRSPISGVIVQRYLFAGEFAQAQPIVRVAQLDPLNVEAVLPGEDYGRVAVGQQARVQLLGPDDRQFEARVVIVEQVIDAASGTFGVRVELPNPTHAVPAGLECLVSFLPDEGGQ